MGRWVPLARVGDIPEGEGRAFPVDEATVGIFNCGGEYLAIDDVCTHAFALLHEGSVDRFRCTVECPLHSTEFDLRTGHVLVPPATEPVSTYPVRVRGGAIEVELPS